MNDLVGKVSLDQLLSALPDELPRFADLCKEVSDWNGVVIAALEHDVVGVLAHYIARLGDCIDHCSRDYLRHQAFLQRAKLHGLDEVLDEVYGVLEDAGVIAVPLKGPVLGERILPDWRLRSSFDIDLLVRSDQLQRALAALDEVGYRMERTPTDAYNLRHQHHITLLHTDRQCFVELHFRAHTGFGTSLPSEELIERAVNYDSPRRRYRILSPEDEVLYLVTHAVGHFVVHYKWLFDIKRVIETSPELRWDLVFERAARHRLRRTLQFGLSDLECSLMPGLADAVGLDSQRRRGAVGVLRLAARGHNSRAYLTATRLLAEAVLADQARDAARLLGHHIGRIARRRAYRLTPNHLPDAWAG